MKGNRVSLAIEQLCERINTLVAEAESAYGPVSRIIVQFPDFSNDDDLTYFKPNQHWQLSAYKKVPGLIAASLSNEIACDLIPVILKRETYQDWVRSHGLMDIPGHRTRFMVEAAGFGPGPETASSAGSITPLVIQFIGESPENLIRGPKAVIIIPG